MTEHVKYPRTFHLPWSPGATSDDKRLASTQQWYGREVVITKKMDGESVTLYRDGLHARSLEFEPRIDRTLIKAIHAEIAYEIPDDLRICGENMTAQHSIPYTNLPDWLLVHSMWINSTCLSWDDTLEWCALIQRQNAPLATVPVIYRGEYSDELCKKLCKELKSGQPGVQIPNVDEGLVVRPADSFDMEEYSLLVGKFVRQGHVQTDEHWSRRIVFNSLAPKELPTEMLEW